MSVEGEALVAADDPLLDGVDVDGCAIVPDGEAALVEDVEDVDVEEVVDEDEVSEDLDVPVVVLVGDVLIALPPPPPVPQWSDTSVTLLTCIIPEALDAPAELDVPWFGFEV